MQKLDEALEWAADYANRIKLFEAPQKANGYSVDGWKGPTADERASIILTLAKEVIKVEDGKFLRDLLQDLHDAAMLDNTGDLVRSVNNIHASLYQHLRQKET